MYAKYMVYMYMSSTHGYIYNRNVLYNLKSILNPWAPDVYYYM